MDLIDRQAAIDAVVDDFCYAYCDNCENEMDEEKCGDCYPKDQNWKASRKAIEKTINKIPSAQKTGHWIMKEKVYGGLIGDSVYRYECSECGFSDEHNSSREVPFCWHCGARMERE